MTITEEKDNKRNFISEKKFFLTGGAGFIGSALVTRLMKKNKIVIYDNFWRNTIKNVPYLNHHNLTIVKGDVLDLENLKKHIKGSNYVIHLAAIAGVDTVMKRQIETMKVNTIGTFNVLEAVMTLDRCERFINFSTSEVFGSYSDRSEETDIVSLGTVGEARWIYAVSKLAGEHITHSYYKKFSLPTVTVRPFNIYGPRQIGEGAMHVFIKRALLNEELQIHGDGDQVRSWCYIDDIVEGILLCLEKEQAIGQIFNIGNPRGTITIHALTNMVINICHSQSRIKFVPKDYVDVDLRIPNIEKARRMLGYEPKVDLENGIKKTADWYKREISFLK